MRMDIDGISRLRIDLLSRETGPQLHPMLRAGFDRKRHCHPVASDGTLCVICIPLRTWDGYFGGICAILE